MLSGIRIYASDVIWRQILADLNATVLDAPTATAVNFDDLSIRRVLTPLELKSVILSASDYSKVIHDIFGTDIHLSRVQTQIVVMLRKSGGMTTDELRAALGYAPDMTTHTVETAIYQLRRKYGHEFIKNTDGVYSLGRL